MEELDKIRRRAMRAAEAVTGRRSWTLLVAGTIGVTALLSVDFGPRAPEPLRDAQGQVILDAAGHPQEAVRAAGCSCKCIPSWGPPAPPAFIAEAA